MARKISVDKDGVPEGWWNRAVKSGEDDMLILLIISMALTVAAIAFYLFIW